MRIHRTYPVLLLAFAAACTDRQSPVTPPNPEPPGKEAPIPIGVYRLHVTGLGTDGLASTLKADPTTTAGPSPVLTAAGTGLAFEQVASNSFTEGTRTGGGQRYVSFTYRVRNMTGVALNNLTLMLVSRASSIAGTPLSQLRKFDGTAADPAVASQVAPTGAVTLGGDLVTMQAVYPDVIQVLTEAEVAAIAPPAGVTNIFPTGYVVRSKNSNANRNLPNTADPNQWDGLMTVSFRLPLQSTSSQDVFSFFFEILAVTDSETRITESIEEAQDTAAVRRLRDRATALGATTTTVLNGSPAMDAAVPDYPGQRQICSPRTAGTAGAPTNTIVTPGAYSHIMILRFGESINSCHPYFRFGSSPTRPATNVPFTVGIRAMDRYGNLKSAQADTVYLVETNGVPAAMSPTAGLTSGLVNMQVTYTDYGNSILMAQGKRLRGYRPIPVAGVVRTWTAGAGTTNWHTNANWSPAAVPMSLDSVLIPLAAPLDPVLAANATVRGVTVEDGATISLNAFDLTAHANVSTGTTGGITNTTGRLFLSGTAMTVQGVVPTLRVNGTYSITEAGGNVTARAPITIEAGRLTVSGRRLQASSQ